MSSTAPRATRSHNETEVWVGGGCALSDSCISVISAAKVGCSITHRDSVKVFRLNALYPMYAIVYLLYWCYFSIIEMRVIFLRKDGRCSKDSQGRGKPGPYPIRSKASSRIGYGPSSALALVAKEASINEMFMLASFVRLAQISGDGLFQFLKERFKRVLGDALANGVVSDGDRPFEFGFRIIGE